MTTKSKRNALIVISVFILLFLLKEFVWDKYIVNPTEWDALKEKSGQPGTMVEVDEDNKLAVLYPGNGFHIYLVSKGYWGWSIHDEIAIPNESSGDPFTAQIKSLKQKGKDNLDIILILSRDKEIDHFIAFDESGEEYRFNRTINREQNTYLYYSIREENVPGKLIYEAYSANDKLLYKE
ncbi:Uncharacterised protein [Chlamydia abortus]|uniref:DUF4340 domain-containing protein n=1 Tax=Paenibacillus residui TaxID=629724 RepID=A0ABW3D882_9BACL|nr:Uncharacterised protein [Chlamydia abortus]